MMALTSLQKTVLACVPNAEDGSTDAARIAGQLEDIGVTTRGVQAILYHLVDKGIIKVDEAGYYRP